MASSPSASAPSADADLGSVANVELLDAAALLKYAEKVDDLVLYVDNNLTRYQGIATAQHEYAWRCHTGSEGVAKDSHRALQFLQTSADKSCAEAQLTLGRMYLVGDGVAADVSKGLALLRRAASQGDPWAQVELSSAFYVGLPKKKTEDLWLRNSKSSKPVPEALSRFLACAACGGEAKRRCGRCGIVKYCSTDCQTKHRPAHKDECWTIFEWFSTPLDPAERIKKAATQKLARKSSRSKLLVALLSLLVLLAAVLAWFYLQ